MQISFSTYINQLIRKDLGMKGVIDWKQESKQTPASHRQKKGRFKEPSVLGQDQKQDGLK